MKSFVGILAFFVFLALVAGVFVGSYYEKKKAAPCSETRVALSLPCNN